MTHRARNIVERFMEAMNGHDAVAVTALLAEDVLFWEPTYDEPRQGRESVRRDLAGFFAMLPDVRFSTETLLVDGDRAVHEWIYRATYGGRPVTLRECAVSRLDADGRLAEVRIYFDRLTLLRQLGLAPELL